VAKPSAKGGSQLELHRKFSQPANLAGGKGLYTPCLNLKARDEFEIKLGKKQSA